MAEATADGRDGGFWGDLPRSTDGHAGGPASTGGSGRVVNRHPIGTGSASKRAPFRSRHSRRGEGCLQNRLIGWEPASWCRGHTSRETERNA